MCACDCMFSIEYFFDDLASCLKNQIAVIKLHMEQVQNTELLWFAKMFQGL